MNKKLYKIKQELEDVLFEMEDPDYSGIIYSEKDNSPKFTVYAEVGYDRLEEICEALDEVIQRYDDGAYFEPDTLGRADCYLWNFNFEDSCKVKDSDPWHESAQYQLIFEDGHKETDSVKLYIKDRYTKEELIEHFQNYYDEKIVDIKQIGWFRDSKKGFAVIRKEFPSGKKVDTKFFNTYDEVKKYFKSKEYSEWQKRQDEYIGNSEVMDVVDLNDSEYTKVPAENVDALQEYLDWEGIYGYTYDIVDVYETKEAKIDDEWKEFDDSEEALNAYFNWEGIYGYTYDIIDILENGKDSDAYLNMIEERDGDEI